MRPSAFSERLASLQPKLSKYKERLDEVSSEIRALESALARANFNLPVSVVVHRWSEDDESAARDELHSYFDGTQWHFEERLTWQNYEGRGFRLLYQKFRQEGYLRYDGCIANSWRTGKNELLIEKPFIDTKVEIRLRLAPKLVDFLEQIDKVLISTQTIKPLTPLDRKIEVVLQRASETIDPFEL